MGTVEALALPNYSIEDICAYVANGGNLLEYVEKYGGTFAAICDWINSNVARQIAYDKSVQDSLYWGRNRVLRELTAIGTVDIREIIDDDGRVKPVNEWPANIAHAVNGIECIELKNGRGVIKKIKLENKIRALELIGKELGMFIERKELNVTTSLADLVKDSIAEDGQVVQEISNSEELQKTDPGV